MLRLSLPAARSTSRSIDVAPTEAARALTFFAAATERLAGVDSSGRSLALLRQQIASVQAAAQLLRDLHQHPWTAARFGLLDLACTSALDLVIDGHLPLADWLATQILAADHDIRRAHEVRALVAVENHRPVRARRYYAKCVGQDSAAPQVRNWLRRQQARMATRAVFGELASGIVGPRGDAVQLWQAALTSPDADQRAQLQALAVAEASRPGSDFDGALWQRRYLLERLADPQEVAAIRRSLDAEELILVRQTTGHESSGEAAPLRPAAPWPSGAARNTTAVVFYLAGPRGERNLAVALAEAAGALTATDRDAHLVVVHGGLDPATVTACVDAAPQVRFVAGDVRRWAAVPVAGHVSRRLMALDALRLAGYERIVLAPVTTGLGESLAAALRHDQRGAASATALRDDVVVGTNLAVVDGELTGAHMISVLDAAAAREFGAARYRDADADAPWRVLRSARDALVIDGALSAHSGFTGYRVVVERGHGPADDADLLARADALIAQVDDLGASQLIAGAVHEPYQLTDRMLLRWAAALHRCSRYEQALRLLDMCGDRDSADEAGAATAWVLHDGERGAGYARAMEQRRPGDPRAAALTARFRAAEPSLPSVGRSLVHVAAFVGRDGNYGDRVLPGAVRKAVSSVSAVPLRFVSVQAHQVFDDARRELADRSAGVIVGGGGLFLPDTAPNGNSGWQWNVPAEQLRRLDVPLAVVGVGFNLFQGQSFSGDLFIRNLVELVDRADLVGLRNHGSIQQVRALLPQHLAAKVDYLPCPTTVLAHLDPELARPVERRRSVLINAAYDRDTLRFGAGYAAFVAQLAGYVTALQRDEVTVCIVSHMAPDEQLAADLYTQHGVNLRLLKLDQLPLGEAYRIYREAGVVVGMRGHATMIPFGLRTPVLSLVSHPKMRYFLADIAHSEWGFEVAGPFEHALLERTRDVLASPAGYVDDIVAAQRSLLDAVQGPLARFVNGRVAAS